MENSNNFLLSGITAVQVAAIALFSGLQHITARGQKPSPVSNQ
jgi:hypothetical protein